MMEDRFGFSLWSRTLGATEVWLAVAYLVCIFGVLVFRPQQIANTYLFRMSYILFAAYLIIPSVVESALTAITADALLFAPRNTPGGLLSVLSVSAMLAKVLFALSIVFALGSLQGKRRDGGRMPEE